MEKLCPHCWTSTIPGLPQVLYLQARLSVKNKSPLNIKCQAQNYSTIVQCNAHQGSILTFCFTGQQDQYYQQISGPQKISLTLTWWKEICKGLNGWANHRKYFNYWLPEMHVPAFWHERLKTIVCESFPHREEARWSLLSKLNEGNIFLVLWFFEAWHD